MAFAIAEGEAFARRHQVRRQAAILPTVDEVGQLARGPAVLVEAVGFDHLFHQADLIVGVEDGETGFETDQFGVAAQDLDTDGVKGAEPRHAFDGAADELADTLLHFARRLVGEGDGEDLRGIGPAGRQDVCDARRQNAGFAGAGTGEDQDGAIERQDSLLLFGIEAVEIGRAARHSAQRALGNGERARRGISARRIVAVAASVI